MVPEELMFWAVLSSCSCLCLNLVIGHSFLYPISFPPHSYSCSKSLPLISAAPSFSLHLTQPLPEKARREVSTFTPTVCFIFQDKQGIPWWLGISYKGIGQYDLQDKVKPRKVSFLHLCGFFSGGGRMVLPVRIHFFKLLLVIEQKTKS